MNDVCWLEPLYWWVGGWVGGIGQHMFAGGRGSKAGKAVESGVAKRKSREFARWP